MYICRFAGDFGPDTMGCDDALSRLANWRVSIGAVRCGAGFLGGSRSEFVSEEKKYGFSDQGRNMACLSSVQEIFTMVRYTILQTALARRIRWTIPSRKLWRANML